jgi:hypothetical protein
MAYARSNGLAVQTKLAIRLGIQPGPRTAHHRGRGSPWGRGLGRRHRQSLTDAYPNSRDPTPTKLSSPATVAAAGYAQGGRSAREEYSKGWGGAQWFTRGRSSARRWWGWAGRGCGS